MYETFKITYSVLFFRAELLSIAVVPCFVWVLHISEESDKRRVSSVAQGHCRLSNGPIIHVMTVRESSVIVNLYGFIDFSSFCFCLVHQSAHVLC